MRRRSATSRSSTRWSSATGPNRQTYKRDKPPNLEPLARGSSGDSELRGDRLQGLNHEGDVLVQVDAELLRALGDIFAVHGAGEPLVFHLLANGGDVDLVDALAGAHKGYRCDESSKFIDCVDRTVHCGLPIESEIVGVAQDGVDDVFRHASFAQDLGPFDGMLSGIRVHLEVEVVEEADGGPALFVAAALAGVGAHGGLDGEGMPAQRLCLRVLAEDVPCFVAVHGASFRSDCDFVMRLKL